MDCRHRVLIVDDHPVVLYGLRFLLKDSEQFAVCGEAGDVVTAQAQVEVLKPDFAILDLVLGGRDGLDLVSDLLALAPRLRILVYSSQNEWRFARRCLAAGAQGYVSKSEGLGVIAQALAVIAGGETFVGEAVRRKLAEAFDPLPGSSLVPMLDQLSDREHQVLRLLGEGQTGREIAEALAISVKTVGTYFERIKEKLQLTSLRDLETFARDQAMRHIPS